VTGVTWFHAELGNKLIEVLHELVPQAELIELCGILGDEVDQAAWFAGGSMTSMPFSNLTPATTFGN
jgi:hypothetical protein